MNKERIDDLVDILSEQTAATENTLLIRNQQELLRYIENPAQWKAQQLNNLKKYKQEVLKIAKSEVDKIQDSAVKVMLIGHKEVNKDSVEVTKTEIRATIPKSVKNNIDLFANKTASEIVMLAQLAVNQHKQNINIISALATPDNLYDTIKKQMERGVDKGFRVVYKDGRTINWKSYMEMKVRTDVHQELAKEQVRAGAKMGVVFYMCDVLGDSADDHADYQGKIYYNADANIPDVLQKYIDANGILSMQEVMQGPPYLTTRPNCRHNFHAVPAEDVLVDTEEEIADNERLVKGDYKESNYGLVQEQRLNERTIRKYKLREQTAMALYNSTQDKSYLNVAKKASAKTKEWQARNRKLIQSNPELLKRESDRENIRVVTQDLGVRYDYTFDKDNNNNPTPTPASQAFKTANDKAKQVKKDKVIPTTPAPVNADTSKTLDEITPQVKASSLLGKVFLGDVYAQDRKDKATWIRPKRGEDASAYERRIQDFYKNDFIALNNKGILTRDVKYTLNEYTGASFRDINSLLRFDNDAKRWYDAKGRSEEDSPDIIIKTQNDIKIMDDFFAQDAPELKLKQDTWFQRGVEMPGMLNALQISDDDKERINNIKWLPNGKAKYGEEVIKILEGKTYEEKGFLSVAGAKGKGFTSPNIIMNIFAPKDTKAVYVAPISNFGGRYNLIDKKKITDADIPVTSGEEAEVILNRGQKLHITKVEYDAEYNRFFVDAEIVKD